MKWFIFVRCPLIEDCCCFQGCLLCIAVSFWVLINACSSHLFGPQCCKSAVLLTQVSALYPLWFLYSITSLFLFFFFCFCFSLKVHLQIILSYPKSSVLSLSLSFVETSISKVSYNFGMFRSKEIC